MSTNMHSPATVNTANGMEWTDYAWAQATADADTRARIRANSALQRDSWQAIDDTVYQVQRDMLTIVDDLRGAGLTSEYPLESKHIIWNVVDDMDEAAVDMSAETAVEEDRLAYDVDGVPLPIVHKDFSLGHRDRPIDGQSRGEGIDTLHASVASEKVAEALEDLVFNGWDATISSDRDNFKLYGLTNHPDIHTGARSDWATDPSSVRGDLRTMIQTLKDDRFRPTNGGYWVYVDSQLEDLFYEADPEGDGNMIVRDRVDQLSDVGNLQFSDRLDDGEIVMFRPTQDVIDLGIASDIQTVQWSNPSGFRDFWKIMAAMAPKIKSTASGQSGIVVYS